MITTRPEKFGTLHFIGIGGIGMSGIAEALHALGYTVQGSDASAGYNTERLERRGIKVFVGHDATHVIDAAAVVVSSAIKPSNPELVAARARKIPVIRRADMLAELMRHKRTISIAGTHGKTTTTSLVGAMLDTANLDPTIINGGIIHAYGTNTRMGPRRVDGGGE
jgi:UDP-N-acetylmuramate--alanine ligase